MNPRHRILAGALCAALALGAAACGGSDSAADHGGNGGGDESFTFGYAMPTGQNPWMNAIADAAQETAAAAGGEMERTDAQLDPAKAVQQVNRFVTDGVAAIAVAPAQVPEALQGSLARAAAEGIKVLALEWSFAEDPAAPPSAPVQGQVIIDRGKLGADVAAKVEEDAGGSAKVIYIGLPFPVASLDFFQERFEAALSAGSEVVDVDNPRDNAQGAIGPLRAALAKTPDADAIVTYNGASALAAIEVVRSAGLAGRVRIYNIQMDGSVRDAVADGRIAAVWDLNAPQLGEALGELIAAAAAGEPEGAWARTVAIEAPMYTAETIDDWTDWSRG